MLCIASMINPFRSANRELGHAAYRWEFISPDDQAVTASDGLRAEPTLPLNTTAKFDYFFVCTGLNDNPPKRSRINAALHRFSRASKVFGALCTASSILARAGFLDGYKFTIHWENLPAFNEEFPNLEVSDKLYVMDRERWTGSGGLSSMDLALNIVAIHHGAGVANAVGNQYQIDRLRSASVGQRPFSLNEYETLPQPLQRVLAVMMVNMETPLTVPELASTAGKTVRSLERMFNTHMDTSPAKFYRKIRLEKVRQLVWHTNLSILEIALMTGFPSPSHLSRLYQQEFRIKPSEDRRERSTL